METAPSGGETDTEGMPGLTAGRVVHYVLGNGQHRPAIVVRDWKQPNGLVNVQVFTDGWNDGFKTTYLVGTDEHMTTLEIGQNVVWRTSVPYSEGKEPETWHWIEQA